MDATAQPPRECDVVVVGAGIIGLAAARELSLRHDGLDVCVLDREPGIGAHQTSHSSGVIHAGIYYRPGSLKARLCVGGAGELYEYCEARGIRTERTGKLIVATSEGELDRLHELERRGVENGVPGLRRVGPEEIRQLEPHAVGIAALHSPSTGVVDFAEVAAAYREDVAERGGKIVTACPVAAVAERDGRALVRHGAGETSARVALVCAGAWSDRLAVAAGAEPEPRIVPFRGGYLRLRPERAHLVKASIYPVPDPDLPFLGAHFTRGHDGQVLLGPSALMVGARDAYRPWRVRARDLRDTLAWPGTWRLIRRFWRTGLDELSHAASKRAFVAEAQRFVPELEPRDFVAGPAGIRAQALALDGSLVDDFVISRLGPALHVRNAPSPAATSSLPLARMIADEVNELLV
jgi:(S)-2-hydroxyglutarate dehydrogenase